MVALEREVGVSEGQLRDRRCSGSRRLRGLARARDFHAETQNHGSQSHTKRKTVHSVHHFSPDDFFSNIDCIILISARCVLSASVAKLKRSASWPAPAVSNKSFTMINAPLWCWIMPVKNK